MHGRNLPQPMVYKFLLLLTTPNHQWCWYGSIKLFLLFANVHTVRNEAVVTIMSLLSSKRSHGPMSPKPIVSLA